MSKLKIAALGAAASWIGCASTLAADGFTFNVGADYTSGKYGGSERTTIWTIPMSAKYSSGPVAVRVSVPWINIKGDGTVIPSGLGGIGDDGGSSGHGSGRSGGNRTGAFPCPGDNRRGASKPEDDGTSCVGAAGTGTAGTTAAARSTESGFGDIVAALVYTPINKSGLVLDIIGKVKFPTASESKGIGTGKTDFALQAEAEQTIGNGFVNGGVGYKWLGDPSGVNLRNVWYGAVGGGYKPTGETTIGLSYDYGQSARSSAKAAQEISLYASQRLTKNIKLNGSIFAGLNDGSPDWGAGVSLGYNF